MERENQNALSLQEIGGSFLTRSRPFVRARLCHQCLSNHVGGEKSLLSHPDAVSMRQPIYLAEPAT
eukprot:8033564-Pyramimonas_sp.AAC.1